MDGWRNSRNNFYIAGPLPTLRTLTVTWHDRESPLWCRKGNDAVGGPCRTWSLLRVAQWNLGPKLSSSGSAGTWLPPTVHSDLWRQETARALPVWGRAGSVLGLTYWTSHGSMGAQNKPRASTSSSCTTRSTFVFSGNVEKAFFPLALETCLPSGFVQLCCQTGLRQVNVISPDSVHFSSSMKSVPELYKDVFNLAEQLNPLTETTPPFYILIVAKLSCQRTASSACEPTTTLRSWRSRGTPGCPRTWDGARTECSESPQESRSLLRPGSPSGFFKAYRYFYFNNVQ